LVLVVIFIFISFRLRHSRFGRALAFIREDEDAAQAMGVNTTRYKLYAYILGAVLGGVAGSFYAVQMGSISPTTFGFMQSANVLLAVILGGMGKIPGVIVGAAFFVIFPELFRNLPEIAGMKTEDMRMLFFGILLVVVMIFRPQGLWPELPRGFKWSARRSVPQGAGLAAGGQEPGGAAVDKESEAGMMNAEIGEGETESRDT